MQMTGYDQIVHGLGLPQWNAVRTGGEHSDHEPLQKQAELILAVVMVSGQDGSAAAVVSQAVALRLQFWPHHLQAPMEAGVVEVVDQIHLVSHLRARMVTRAESGQRSGEEVTRDVKLGWSLVLQFVQTVCIVGGSA